MTPAPSPVPKKRRWGLWFLIALGVAVGAASLAVFSPGRGDVVQIDVPEGANAHRVARRLIEKGIIKSRVPFLAWVRVRGASQKIHVGRYAFPKGRAAYWIVDDLIEGRTQKIKVVIPEGLASWQIAERLEAADICRRDAFLNVVADKKLEGYLFPATYEFDAALNPASVAAVMKAKFDASWTPEMEARAKEINFTRSQVVTLASIVEREVRVREEGPTIAAVYHNRLKKGMRLEADPTVQFAKGHWVSRLTYADYRNTVSPYNTYRVNGLPPGPICSPGADSIRATLWPAQSDALYFVAMEGGRHDFSSTYRDHTNKVNRRNRLRKQKK